MTAASSFDPSQTDRPAMQGVVVVMSLPRGDETHTHTHTNPTPTTTSTTSTTTPRSLSPPRPRCPPQHPQHPQPHPWSRPRAWTYVDVAEHGFLVKRKKRGLVALWYGRGRRGRRGRRWARGRGGDRDRGVAVGPERNNAGIGLCMAERCLGLEPALVGRTGVRRAQHRDPAVVRRCAPFVAKW